MKKQKKSPCRKRTVFSLLLSAGLSASLILGSPAFAEEAATDTAASSITTNQISGWPQGPEITVPVLPCTPRIWMRFFIPGALSRS